MKKNTLTATMLRLSCLVGAAALSAPTLAADNNNPAFQALFDQAEYWHQRAHDDLAKGALQKVLAVDADNTRAIYLMALYSQQRGDNAEATKWRARLAGISPQDPRLQALDNSRRWQDIPPAQLALARQQARSGNIAASLQTWRNLFDGGQPPANVAVEYYLTMAGDRTLWPQAVDGLRQFTAANPQDTQARLALGKALTYQESTRREGLRLLDAMASGNPDVDGAMRQALLWMSPQLDDAPLYDNYQQRHPQDNAVMTHYRTHVGGAALGKGFAELNSGDTDGAQRAFEQVLQAAPQDADALAGLGYIAQRRGDYASAANYLEQAAKQGGENSVERQQQAEDARFYAQLSVAQQAMKTGNTPQALALSEPLMQADGERGIAVRLFRADVQRRSNQLTQAEQSYRDVLTLDANNSAAKEGLYYVLQRQNRSTEAEALLAELPDSVRQRLAPRVAVEEGSASMRRAAERERAAGHPAQAIALLQQAVQRWPADGWVRYDLARIYKQQGDMTTAADVMQPLYRPGAGAEQLFAGALFASQNGAWQQTGTLLARVPERQQTSNMRALARRASFNLQMQTARDYLKTGSNVAAANTLKALAVNPPADPQDAGELAQALASAGDVAGAVGVVRSNMQRGVQGNAGDYAAQVAVLNQSGLSQEAQAWLSNPDMLSRSTPEQLASVRNGGVIQEADRLREARQYAAAYDKLIGALQHDPQNTDLMLAMARLYQSGKMNQEAATVYDYLMTRDTPSQDACVGAIDVALAQNDVSKASALADGLRDKQTPERLLLLARVADAKGDKAQALAYLRTARGKMIGLRGAESGSLPVIGGLALSDNPFINRTTESTRRSPSTYGSVMPWQQRDETTDYRAVSGQRLDGTQGTTTASAQNGTFRQINQMMDALESDTGTWTQAGVQVRGRDGESGLSKLTEAKAPLTWSSAPLGEDRFNVTVTPVTLSAGSAEDTSSRRFGLGAIQQSIKAQAESSSDSFNLDKITADSPGAQNATGVELNLALTGKQYKADIGSTPLGQDLSTLVGGVQWSPKLTDFLTLVLTGERRAVTDSLLSYVGARDAFGGQKWGRVTKNGGTALLSYDDGDAGFYGGAGAYSYLGENVKSNKSLVANAGAYVRPYHDSERELKTGISLSWMDFSRNLSYYSYGQGGYFSPQNFVSVAFPIDYTQKYDDLSVKIGGALGYQSYSQDRSAYYPNNPEWQRMLETAAAQGLTQEAYYPGTSKNGIGYNLHAGADYKINRNVTIGGQLGYDTFGDYNESHAQLYFRYRLGGE
ncbi:cellulose synthase subunit BcsC-related outer membrane protein [Lonsdalea quercina]|uniref:cellulose biosynthesis protein BcsC n=1 Tax=Lonsdalea quercina TaxID=71657 RepID=UPI0039748D11